MNKSPQSDLLIAAVFMLCTGIGWWHSQLVAGAIVGIALALAAAFIYKGTA